MLLARITAVSNITAIPIKFVLFNNNRFCKIFL